MQRVVSFRSHMLQVRWFHYRFTCSNWVQGQTSKYEGLPPRKRHQADQGSLHTGQKNTSELDYKKNHWSPLDPLLEMEWCHHSRPARRGSFSKSQSGPEQHPWWSWTMEDLFRGPLLAAQSWTSWRTGQEEDITPVTDGAVDRWDQTLGHHVWGTSTISSWCQHRGLKTAQSWSKMDVETCRRNFYLVQSFFKLVS